MNETLNLEVLKGNVILACDKLDDTTLKETLSKIRNLNDKFITEEVQNLIVMILSKKSLYVNEEEVLRLGDFLNESLLEITTTENADVESLLLKINALKRDYYKNTELIEKLIQELTVKATTPENFKKVALLQLSIAVMTLDVKRIEKQLQIINQEEV